MARGGLRAGSGRPACSGKFREETKAIRVPKSQVDNVTKYLERKNYQVPLFQDSVSAGFPSPAEGESKEVLDLNDLLVKRPAATFFLRVAGVSMIKAGIHPGDILVVDRSLAPVSGKIVIASLNGELTVKRLESDGKRVRLMPENDSYSPIDITEEVDLRIWGVVTSVIHLL